MGEVELRRLLVELLEASGHPEIVSVSSSDDRGVEGAASVRVRFDDGSSTCLYVYPDGGWPKPEPKSVFRKRWSR